MLNIDSKKSWVVCICASLFFFFEYFQINMYNILDKPLMVDFNINTLELSLISSVYFYGTVLLLIPAGIALDVFSVKKLMIYSMAISVIGTIFFSFSNGFYSLALSRGLVGIGAGPLCLISSMKLISQWFSNKKSGLVSGVVVSVGILGGVISQAPFSYLVSSFGWRTAVQIDSLVGLIILILIFCFVDEKNHSKEKFLENKLFIKEILNKTRNVLFKKKNISICIYAAFLNLPTFLIGSLIGSLYIEQTYKVSHLFSSIVNTFIYLGILVGSPFFGFLHDRVDKNRGKFNSFFCGYLIVLLSIMYEIVFMGGNIYMTTLSFFLIGFGTSAHVCVYPVMANRNNENVGIAESIAACSIMLAGAIFQPIFGALVNFNLKTDKSFQLIYSAQNYKNGFLLILIMLITGLFLTGFKKSKMGDSFV
ncbi:MAG: MFS transporter [Gammaproteobacteria bacterium]